MKSKYLRTVLTCLSILSVTIFYACKDDEEAVVIANEIGLSGAAEKNAVEGDAPVTVTYSFVAATRKAGVAKITATVQNLAYGTNYTTDPAEAAGIITVPFVEGASNVSFTITIIDDQVNLPDGSATFTLTSIEGENADISPTAAVFKLNLQDNEGESITLTSTETLSLGEVVPGTSTSAKEIAFTSINIVSDITATASAGFVVSATTDGTYAGTATLPLTATSVFVKAAPAAGASIGESTGTVTLAVAAVTAVTNVKAYVSGSLGTLFWVENFNYPASDTYPAYLDTYPSIADQLNWGVIPSSAYLRLAATYNGTNAAYTGLTGMTRTGSLDTWYTQTRLYGVAMGDGPLTFAGYPNSGVGRTARLAQDYSNLASRASTAASNPCGAEGEFGSKNSAMARRFVENGSEITSGNVYLSALIKVNELFDETTPILKNAVIMLTGDATFVNANAMKINIRKVNASTFNFGVSKSGDDGSVVYGTTAYNVNETYAVVMEVQIKADGAGGAPNDVLSVYVFKAGDAIPSFTPGTKVPEATITDSGELDLHDVTTGLEIVYFREVADVFGAGGVANIAVHDVEFTGIRVATTWAALFSADNNALYDSQSADLLQTKNYGQVGCTIGGPEKLGNKDK